MKFSGFHKYVPFAALIGYVMVYSGKGYDKILTDIQNITLTKLQAKWQNFAVAAVILVIMYFLKSVKLPANLKLIITIVGWFIVGYQIGLAIDPPGNGNGYSATPVNVQVPRYYNPYAALVRGAGS